MCRKTATFGQLTTLGCQGSIRGGEIPSISCADNVQFDRGKPNCQHVINPRSRGRGFRSLSTIYVLDTEEKACLAGNLRSVQRTRSGSESGRTETRFDPP